VYFNFVTLVTLAAMLFTLPLSVIGQGRIVRDPSRGVGDGSKIEVTDSKVGAADSKGETNSTETVCSNGHINFTTDGDSTSSTWGNVRTYSGGNVSVKARAWERTKGSGGTWQTAFLGQYGSAGLGVTDRVEGGGDPNHKVDNNGRLNYIAFAFNQPVSIDDIQLNSVSTDSDMTVYIGTVANAYTTLPTLSDALLAGFYSETNTGGSSDRDADVNAGNVVGNVLVVAARVDQENDYFKVANVYKNCPSTQITFVKQVFTVNQTHASTQSFGFTSTGLSSSSFSLVDNNVVGPDRITFSVAANANVTVTESAAGGWTLSGISCVGTQNWSWLNTGTMVSVTPASGQNVTCTFTNAQLGASAAKVDVSGRAMLSNSRGISGAVLTLWDVETSQTRQVTTNSLGYYVFSEVEVGKFYVVSISHPRYVFSQNMQTFTLEDSLTSLDFVY
jgi:hypothetical protein